MTAQDIIRLLGLKPLPEEGGYYKETYRAEGKIADRSYCTAIYYLITLAEFSRLHRVRSDEIFHFYAGDPVEMVQITPNGDLQTILIGNDLSAGAIPQAVVSANVWQGTRLVDGGQWALLGCTVAPGFEFKDFEAGSFENLSRQFPQHTSTLRLFSN